MAEPTEFYFTLAKSGQGLYREKGSKFIALAVAVGSVDEVREVLATVRKKYYDARHVCYAYVLGRERAEFRANDDGEPSGTAGRPILGQLHARNLTDVLVVVVRYFGGVLLGTGGLVVAYKEAAADALNNSVIIKKQVEEVLTITFAYERMNEVLKCIREHRAGIVSQLIRMECIFQVVVAISAINILINQLEKTEGVKVDW